MYFSFVFVLAWPGWHGYVTLANVFACPCYFFKIDIKIHIFDYSI